jgi:PIN domain nuclease of toxin-antitoxin system
MAAVVADTHASLWYLIEPDRLSSAARQSLRAATEGGDGIYVSAISVVEVTYLVERGKLPQATLDVPVRAMSDEADGMREVPVDLAVAVALRRIPRAIVPDMPDRIIAATAAYLDMPLVTRDREIRQAGIQTIW